MRDHVAELATPVGWLSCMHNGDESGVDGVNFPQAMSSQ